MQAGPGAPLPPPPACSNNQQNVVTAETPQRTNHTRPLVIRTIFVLFWNAGPCPFTDQTWVMVVRLAFLQ